MIIFNTYYCPACGKGCESKDCELIKTFWRSKMLCKNCNVKVTLSCFSFWGMSAFIYGFLRLTVFWHHDPFAIILASPPLILGTVTFLRQIKFNFKT